MTNSNFARNKILNKRLVPEINPSAMLNGALILRAVDQSDIKQYPAV